jgi:GTP-binding protein
MVAWRREKYVPRGGPAGGDGGRGGDVVLVADPQLSTLLDLRYRPELFAEHGEKGGARDKNGRAGADLRVPVPVGTVVWEEAPRPTRGSADDEEDEHAIDDARAAAEILVVHGDEDDHAPLGDLVAPGQTLVAARGGRGGRGNIHFRSSTNRAPDRAEPGGPGEERWLRLELKLLADVGIVGFPNVGKSTLISRISRARPKIADYPFTTLVPQLGVVDLGDRRSMVVADVPGLVRGASEGRGLGLQFLRHLERTRVLLHLLAPDLDPEREPLRDLDALEEELSRYGPVFAGRPRVVALNKIDLLEDRAGKRRVADLRRALRARHIPLFCVSAATGAGLPELLAALWRRVARVRG